VTTTREAAVDRIRQLEEALAREPARSARRRQLIATIRLAVARYRRVVDSEQAVARFPALRAGWRDKSR
jgi:hypothetical protein